MNREETGSGVVDDASIELDADPDHHAILARRNRLIALAVAGLASTLSCGRSAMDRLGAGGSNMTRTSGVGGSAGVGSGSSTGGQTGGDSGGVAIADAGGQDGLQGLDALMDATDAYEPSGCGCGGGVCCQSCT
jgi:hypothetical protein